MQTANAQTLDAPIHQRRAHKRFDYSAPCLIQKEDSEFKSSVRNISAGGLNVTLDQLGVMQVGKTVTLRIGDFDPIGAVIRWNEGSAYGLQFLSPVGGHPELSELIEKLSSDHTF